MSMKFISIRSINKLKRCIYIEQQCVSWSAFEPYKVWILLNTVIKYINWSICKTIQMLYHGRLQHAGACISHQQFVGFRAFQSYNIWYC